MSFFSDSFADLNWDAGRAVVKMGLDYSGVEMDYADYQTLGTWEIENVDFSDEKVTLKLRERKTRLLDTIPFETITRDEFPAAKQDAVGKFKPIIYGKVYGITPLEVNAATKTFKVAGHPIKAIDAVRLQGDDESWTTVAPTSVNLTTAEFTLGDEYDGARTVVCDVQGRITTTGELMTNPADVVLDLLELIGETEIRFSSFETGRLEYYLGTDDRGREVNALKPAIYVDVAQKAQDVISTVNKFCACYLYIDRIGEWVFKAFTPTPLASLVYDCGNVESTVTGDPYPPQVEPEVPFDGTACAMLGITDGGGDTFDCYAEG